LQALCLALVLARPAAGQPIGSRFVLTYDPSSERQQQALAAVRAHLRGLSVELVTEAAAQDRDFAERLAASGALATSHSALGTFSIEQGADRSILVFFTEPGGSATLVRRLPTSELDDRVAIEQAAIVVRSLVEALIEGGHLGVVAEGTESAAPARGEAPASPESTRRPRNSDAAASTPPESSPSTLTTEPRPAPGDAASRRFFVFLGYAGAYAGSELSWQQGASVGARWLFAPTAYFGARYTLIPPSEVDTPAARISLTRRPAELLFGYAAGTWVLANLELSALFEQTSRETLATDAAFEPTRASSHWSFGIGPRAGAMWAPWRVLRVAVRAGADFMVAQPTYTTVEQTVAAPARVRPRLEFELGVGVW
jgi:hypothetical protein